jgi:hypothetical protein
MAAGKGIRKRKCVIHGVNDEAGENLTYQAMTDAHGRFIYNEGVMCYEANEDGSLTLYVDRGDGESVEVVIEARGVGRLMYAAVDALGKEPSRR